MKRVYKLKRKYERVGAMLAAARQRSGKTQREASNLLGYSSAQFISNFERGIALPPLKKLPKLLRFYNVSVTPFIAEIINAERKVLTDVLR